MRSCGEPFRSRMQQQADAIAHRMEVAELKERIEELEAENTMLCTERDAWKRGRIKRIEELEAALHCISLTSQNSMSSKEDCGKEARAALKEQA